MSTIFHKIHGGGYPLIFLHGFCETHSVWNGLAKELKNSYKIVTMDLPGFGSSPLPENDFSIDDIAVMVKEKIKELGIKRLVMIGHSLGGYITMSFVRQFPEIIDGFCLFNSTVFEDTPDKRDNRNKLIDLINRNGTSSFIQTFIPSLFFQERLDEFKSEIGQLRMIGKGILPKAVTSYAAAMRDRADEAKTLESYKSKALVIAGKEDKNVPESVSLKMGSIIGGNKCFIFERTAHMAMYESKPEAISTIKKFAGSMAGSGNR